MSDVLDRSHWRGRDLSARLTAIYDAFVQHADIRRVFDEVDRRRKHILARLRGRELPPIESVLNGARTQLGEGVLVVGASGSGKTTLAEEIHRRNPRVQHANRTEIGSAIFSVPRRVNSTTMGQELLIAFGHLDIGGKPDDLFRRAVNLGRKCIPCGGVIMIDNYHDIPARSGVRGIGNAGDWTRSLIDALPVVVIALGTEDAIPVVQSNEQLLSRMQTRITLQGYLKDIGEVDGLRTRESVMAAMRKYKSYLVELDKQLPLAESSNLEGIARRFHFATLGSNRVTRNLLSYSIESPVSEGRESLTLLDLEQGFCNMAGDVKPHENPFSESFDFQPLTLKGRLFHRMAIEK